MKENMQRNLRLYPWYVGFFHAYFWLPIYFLFFNSKLNLSDVLYLESIYFTSVVLLEVPSGWFSDTFGRKKTLVTASLLLSVAYILFIFADSFEAFAIAQILLAGGIAFNSGTDTSFLLETTQTLNQEDTYASLEAKATKFNFLGTAVAGVLGGLAAIPDFRGAYILSFCGAVILLLITLNFKEPNQCKAEKTNFFAQIISCIKLLKNTSLLWFSFFAVFMIIINHIPYEFYQPYVEEFAQRYSVSKSTPLLTSIHLTLTMLIAAWVASRSIQIRNRIGTSSTLLSAAGLQVLMMAVMYVFVNIPAVIATLLRSCPRALMTAPLHAAVAPIVPAKRRATFLSLQSLFGRLGFSITLATFGALAGGEQWASISKMLGWGMWCGLVVLVLLLVASKVIKTPD